MEVPSLVHALIPLQVPQMPQQQEQQQPVTSLIPNGTSPVLPQQLPEEVLSAAPLTGHKRDSMGNPVGSSVSSDSTDGGNYVKLFVGSVPKTITEDQVRPMFAEHGNVLEVALIKDKRTGQQQGCCFVKYGTREEAERAVRCLNNQQTLPGGTSAVQVRYADGERERLGAVEHKLFVGCLNKQASEKEIEEIFIPYGRVDDVYIMRDEQKQSRGCAFVKYPSREMAQAAINALNNTYVMRGCDQPLAVRFADPKRPKTGDSRGGGSGLSPRPGTGSASNRSSGAHSVAGRASPINWRSLTGHGMRQAGPAPFPPPVIPRVSPSQAASPLGIPGQINGLAQSPYTAQNLGQAGIPTHQQQAFHQLQRPGQSFAQQGSMPQYVQLSQQQQHPYPFSPPQQSTQQHYQPAQQQYVPSQQQLTPQPSQQSFGHLQPTQQQFPSIQSGQQQFTPLQPIQQQSLQQSQHQQMGAPPLQTIPHQQQVFQPNSMSHSLQQQPSWLLPQIVPSILPPPAAPVTPTCNWTEHISPEGYKYYYNSVTAESKWEKPEELLKFEQQQQTPGLNYSQVQPNNGGLDQFRQQVRSL